MMEEAFKKLKINFQFVGNDTKKILITSSIPNEGKSFVAVAKPSSLRTETGYKAKRRVRLHYKPKPKR